MWKITTIHSLVCIVLHFSSIFIANVLFPISLLSMYNRHVAVIFHIRVEAKRNKGSQVFSSLKTHFLKLLNK